MAPGFGRRRLVLLVVGGALALVGFFFVQTRFVPPEGVVEAVRDPGNEAAVGDTAAGAYSFNFTSVNLTTRAESAHATAVPPDARVLASTIAVYNFDDSLVMQRLGLELFKQLRDSKRFEKVHYLPLGERLADGERVPDLFVTLDLNAWQESGIPGFRLFEGEVVATFSDRLRTSGFHVVDEFEPPRTEFSWESGIRYGARQLGFERPRFMAVGQQLAKNIAANITKLLDDLETAHGEPPELADDFYPQYVAPPAIPMPYGVAAHKLFDGPSVMAPTFVTWRTDTLASPGAALAAIAESLEREGFEVRNTLLIDVVYASRGEELVEAFREAQPERHFSSNGPINPRFAPPSEPGRLHVIYQRRLPTADAAPLRQLIASGASNGTPATSESL